MDIMKLPVMWLQELYNSPYQVYVSDIKTDTQILVFDYQDNNHYPFYASEKDLFPTEEEADKNRKGKIESVDACQTAFERYYEYCSDEDKDNWIVKLVDGNHFYEEHLKEERDTYKKIISTYRSGIMNIDGMSFRVNHINTVKFGEKTTNSETDAHEIKVLLTTNSGKNIGITLHSDIDIEYFMEFFGNNTSGYYFSKL